MKKTFVIVLFTLSINFSNAQDLKQFSTKTDVFLKSVIKNRKVDYDAIKKNTSSINEIVNLE